MQPVIKKSLQSSLSPNQSLVQVNINAANGTKPGAGDELRRHPTPRMLQVEGVDIDYNMVFEEICASSACDNAQEIANALYDSVNEFTQEEI